MALLHSTDLLKTLQRQPEIAEIVLFDSADFLVRRKDSLQIQPTQPSLPKWLYYIQRTCTTETAGRHCCRNCFITELKGLPQKVFFISKQEFNSLTNMKIKFSILCAVPKQNKSRPNPLLTFILCGLECTIKNV